MLLSDSSPQSASVVASSMPPYTKRSTALAPAAVSLLFRSAAVSDGAIEMVTVFSALAEREVGLIHGMSGSGGYVGGTRLMSEGRDFLGRVLAWCLVALAWTWWATAQERDQTDVRAARTVCGRPGRREQSSQGVCARRERCAAARVSCSLEMNWLAEREDATLLHGADGSTRPAVQHSADRSRAKRMSEFWARRAGDELRGGGVDLFSTGIATHPVGSS